MATSSALWYLQARRVEWCGLRILYSGSRCWRRYSPTLSDANTQKLAGAKDEERFRLVANTAPVLIWMSGTDKLYTYFNQGWLDFTGRSFEAELGNGWTERVHSADLGEVHGELRRGF